MGVGRIMYPKSGPMNNLAAESMIKFLALLHSNKIVHQKGHLGTAALTCSAQNLAPTLSIVVCCIGSSVCCKVVLIVVGQDRRSQWKPKDAW